jgi:hypothetical protein
MGEKNLRKYITYDDFKQNVADWSYDTFKRRIDKEGFPAIKDGGGYLIPVDEMDLWFKRRRVKS